MDIGGRGHHIPSREGRGWGVVLKAVIGDAGGETECVKVRDQIDARGFSS